MKFFLLSIGIIISFYAVSQDKRKTIWHFGESAGISFADITNPIPINTSSFQTDESIACISDENTGRLLFYTDGQEVIDSTYNPMCNGTGLGGHESSTQGSLIIPKPFCPGQYYIFTTTAHNFIGNANTGLMYSVVDMTQNGGIGCVTEKNVFLHEPVTEKLTAIPHANGTDYWIIAHEFNNANFLSYKISSNGIDAPLVQSIGGVHDGNSFAAVGAMKASPQGDKLALAIGKSTLNCQIFDFDNTTGMLTNPITLPISNNYSAYGVSFSPNGSLLYVSNYINPNSRDSIFQFDLNAGTNVDIINSKYTVNAPPIPSGTIGGMQLGPDGKIYITLESDLSLSVINNPDGLGATCDYQHGSFSIAPGECYAGLPNFPESWATLPDNTIEALFSNDTVCLAAPMTFNNLSTVAAGSIDNFLWNFDDPSSGSLDTSSLINPTHQFSQPGNYKVSLIVSKGCLIDTFIKEITVQSTIETGLTPKDTLICPNDSVVLQVNNFDSISWTPLTNLEVISPTSVMVSPSVSTSYYVFVWDSNGCSNYDTAHINVSNDLAIFLGEDTVLCNDQFIELAVDPQTSQSYLWSNGSTDNKITVNKPGSYSVTVSKGNCVGSDTIDIGVCNNIFLPNVFTPTGLHPNLRIFSNEETNISIELFNRHGKKVYKYEGSSNLFSWNGSILKTSEVLTYHLRYDDISQAGTITVIF